MCAMARATIGESLKAVTRQLHEAESKNRHLIELETDLQQREERFERQVTATHCRRHLLCLRPYHICESSCIITVCTLPIYL